MQGSLVLARIAGIEIRAHFSWLVVLALVSWSLASAYFPSLYPEFGTTTNWLLGFVSALLLFGAVLLHELSHSFVARARGLGVHSITLFIFGGVSNLIGEPRRPLGEFLIAAAGPATSLVLAAICYILAQNFAHASPEAGAVLQYLATINLVLGLFNLVPGFPLDGGRVLRSILWHSTGSFQRATRIAASIGQALAYGFIFWGVWQVLSGNVLGGIWIALIGWFLSTAAEGTAQQATLQQYLERVRVRELMRSEPLTVEPTLPIVELVDTYMLGHNLRALPVVENGRLAGMVTLGDVKEVPRETWATKVVRNVMSGREGLVTVAPDLPLAEALSRMAERDLERLPVLANGELVGILSRSDIIRYLQVRAALESSPTKPPSVKIAG